MENNSLVRFLDAQNQIYLKALSEIKNGKKETHWMWFIFPQLQGIGRTETAKFFGIENIEEAEAYLAHPVLGKHLIQISEAMLNNENESAREILGKPDDRKLRSSMTLFASLPNTNPVFQKVLEKYYEGLHDELTLEILSQSPHQSYK